MDRVVEWQGLPACHAKDNRNSITDEHFDERVAADQSGRVFEYARAAYRGDRCRYHLRVVAGDRGERVSWPVYDRGGEPCVRCGRRLVTTHAIDLRQTTLCAFCQR